MNNFTRSGILFVVSAPSGTGKTTLCTNVRQTPDLVYSVSCTTRPQRPGEKDGVDYFFMGKSDFEKKMKTGEMLEFADVYGHYYGTPKGPVLAAGGPRHGKFPADCQKNPGRRRRDGGMEELSLHHPEQLDGGGLDQVPCHHPGGTLPEPKAGSAPWLTKEFHESSWE